MIGNQEPYTIVHLHLQLQLPHINSIKPQITQVFNSAYKFNT